MPCFYCAFVRLIVVFSIAVNAYADGPLTLEQPQPHQVMQRKGIASEGGYANVPVRGVLPSKSDTAVWEYRVVPTTTDNRPAPNQELANGTS